METLLKFLGLNTTFNQVDLYVSGIYNPIGKGIEYDEYVLTLEHITNDVTIFTTHRNIIEYKSIFKIDEYDIDILCQKGIDGNIEIFLKKLMNTNYIKIKDINKNIDTDSTKSLGLPNLDGKNTSVSPITLSDNDSIYKVYKSNLTLQYEQIECIELKSTIFPQIPIIKCNIYTNYLDELSGLSGSIVYRNNKILGILTSDYKENIEILPFEFIIDIMIMTHKYCRRYCPLQMNNNIIQKTYKSLKKNDMIIKIDDIDIDDFGKIYYDKYDIFIPIKTYILLKKNKHIDIKICRNVNKIKKYYDIKYLIDKFNESNITINFRENTKEINIKNVSIKELSEEFIAKTDKKICAINDDIYSNKKILYVKNVKNINNINLDLDLEKNVYILRKISGHNINNINQIKKYISQTHCVLELKDPNNNIIKIRI